MLLGGKSYAFATQKLRFYTLLIINKLQQGLPTRIKNGKTEQFSRTRLEMHWLSCRLVVLLFGCLVVLLFGNFIVY